MITYDKYILRNGLKLIVHQDRSTPVVAFNLTYNVGARDEDPERTGFAHLFEHLMFGGSKNIPSFDEPLQRVGGENNAFTSNDITNYYITLPKNSLETAFWLESDRMKELAFSENSLEVQRQVVVEEFKQRYLNQPYGDVHLLLRPLAYKSHPYMWPTIGKSIKHIEEASMKEVKEFFYRYYRPNNAVLSVVGDVESDQVLEMTKKWFGDIPSGELLERNLPKEEPQDKPRQLSVERDVPLDAIYKAYHIVSRNHQDYYAFDLMSDILSRGNSSRLRQRMIKGDKLCNDCHAYIGGEFDEGLFTFSAHLNPSISFKEIERAWLEEVNDIAQGGVTQIELEKVINKVESSLAFSKSSSLNKAMALSISEVIGNVELVNQELKSYQRVSLNDIQRVAKEYIKETNCSTLYYKSKNQKHES